jgi:hypothetical protein
MAVGRSATGACGITWRGSAAFEFSRENRERFSVLHRPSFPYVKDVMVRGLGNRTSLSINLAVTVLLQQDLVLTLLKVAISSCGTTIAQCSTLCIHPFTGVIHAVQ